MMKLTKNNYYSPEANREYMSVSQFKAFEKCEAMALAEVNEEYKQPFTSALLLGQFVDEMLTGTKRSQNVFIEEHRDELFKRNGEPYADVARALDAIERVRNQPLMMKYLSGRHQKIMTGRIEGVPFKIKMDVYKPVEFITDLKYMAGLRSPNLFEPMVSYWGYDLQGAVYQEIVYQNTGYRLPFHLCIATKETPAHLELCRINQYDLDDALDRVKSKVKRYAAIKSGQLTPERCEEYDCNYCTGTRIITDIIDASMLGMTRKKGINE